MSETSRAVMYGSAKPETKSFSKKTKGILSTVHNKVDEWLNAHGVKDIEDRFAKAHQSILESLSKKEQKQAFAQTEKAWKTTGKALGIAATAIDFGLIAYGFGLGRNRNTQFSIEMTRADALKNLRDSDLNSWPSHIQLRLFTQLFQCMYGRNFAEVPDHDSWFFDNVYQTTPREQFGRRVNAALPNLGSLAILAGLQPAHLTAKGLAWGTESIGKLTAKSLNKKS